MSSVVYESAFLFTALAASPGWRCNLAAFLAKVGATMSGYLSPTSRPLIYGLLAANDPVRASESFHCIAAPAERRPWRGSMRVSAPCALCGTMAGNRLYVPARGYAVPVYSDRDAAVGRPSFQTAETIGDSKGEAERRVEPPSVFVVTDDFLCQL
ncbi:hypothetical protein B0H15DRAFT_1001724 [Mycena belliarum]|uniref:Uncharacterized protein n=1 Tax=Mycena belliarum TaxID=1033014 RepID=A0AAD6TXR3_9AGAR|nr:hypothetical protein B0H15DRAFT_1001724 [Mycena belliae]